MSPGPVPNQEFPVSTLALHAMSHTDHVPAIVLGYVLGRFTNRTGFFTDTFELPKFLPELDLTLYGPVCGDPPVSDEDTVEVNRPGRDWKSRCVNRPAKKTRLCTIIAGPWDGNDCVLYTVFGGPLAPHELGDPALLKDEAKYLKSREFWRDHALVNPFYPQPK